MRLARVSRLGGRNYSDKVLAVRPQRKSSGTRPSLIVWDEEMYAYIDLEMSRLQLCVHMLHYVTLHIHDRIALCCHLH